MMIIDGVCNIGEVISAKYYNPIENNRIAFNDKSGNRYTMTVESVYHLYEELEKVCTKKGIDAKKHRDIIAENDRFSEKKMIESSKPGGSNDWLIDAVIDEFTRQYSNRIKLDGDVYDDAYYKAIEKTKEKIYSLS